MSAETGPRHLGKYELRQRLARGGMGEVWKAYDPQLRRFVALKLLHANLQTDPDFRERFEHEAQFIASLHHPNIVKIHDFQFVQEAGTDSTTAYMVMDYIEGPTLAEYIRNTSRKGTYPPASEIVYIFTAMSLALDYAHSKGMIHRDIKPANILLDQRFTSEGVAGEPVLTDFGIAKLQGVTSGTVKGMLLGTPLYIAPEQAQGRQGDERSDLYSLGIILYEIMTGITPFRGDSDVAILMQHVHEMPTPPALINPNIPPALSAVVLKSIAKDPDARFDSASAMTIILAEALNVPVPSTLRRNRPSTDLANTPTSRVPPGPGSLTPSPPVSSPSYTPQLPYQTPSFPAPYVTPSQPGRAYVFNPVESPLSPVGSSQPSAQPDTLTPGIMYAPQPSAALAVGASAPISAPAAPGTTPPASPAAKRRRGLYIALAAVAIVALIGSVVAAFSLSAHTNTPVATLPSGHILFLNSQNTRGFNQVQITIPQLPPPISGTSYFAWLYSRDDSIAPVAWPISPTNGGLSTSLTADAQHQDLLNQQFNYYIFLITEESTSTPVSPTLDPSKRVYYASIPQAVSPSDHLRLIDHLDHLLIKDPNLPNSLNYWLMKNTQALDQQAVGINTALHSKDAGALRQHLVNMLYYLDSKDCAPSYLIGLPAGASAAPDNAIINDTQVSLLDCPQNTTIKGLLAHTAFHLGSIVKMSDATKEQTDLAKHISTQLNSVNAQLQQVQKDAAQLVKLSDSQLLQYAAQAQFSDLVTTTHAAYSGQNGIQDISKNITNLPTFDIFRCPPSGNICT